ncbi:MAG TPA: ribonuclease III [Holophagaceae bacterium]|jgi:ribonuclease-3|nr:ribonuclease III [Holophagaceae bacterium]
MASSKNRAPLQAALGHSFRDASLLEEALTHASSGGRDNQRLEFLGDAILNAAAAALIHRLRPDWEEGSMSKLRNLLVRTETLAEWAGDIGVELRQSMGKAKARMGVKPMADALEALLGAVYLDGGEQGFAAVARLVEARFGRAIREAHEGLWAQADPKTTLQERAASLGLPKPVYTLLSQAGPDHAPRFQVRAAVGSKTAQAEGGSRKGAEVEAARQLLEQLQGA